MLNLTKSMNIAKLVDNKKIFNFQNYDIVIICIRAERQ